jgi:uncharacterized protein
VPSGGIGPHELVWCADGRTLVIANGGLETDPAFARRNLNTSELSSSLALLDVANGSIVATTTAGAGLGMLSIRHLAVDASGAVWFGCQSEGDPLETPPLVGRLSADGAVQMIELPEDLRFGPRNYIGSVAVSGDGRTVALSAPRGGIVLGFDTATRAFLGSIDLKDGCGLAPGRDGLLATAGTGVVVHMDRDGEGVAETPCTRFDVAFDNHMVPLA